MVTVTAPVEPLTLIPVPATAEVTPVLVNVNAGYVPVADIPVPFAMLTVWSGAVLVTVKLG